MFNFIKHKIFQLLFPSYCVRCQKLGAYLCFNCFEQINFFSLAINIDLEKNYLDEVYALANYQAPVSTLIHALKYQGVKGISTFLANLIWQNCYFPYDKNTIITAVPIHHQRKLERGFNQAAEIAQHLAQLTKLQYQALLIKKINTKHQAQTKNKQARLNQLTNSFCLNQKFKNQTLKQIILIDDVLTTGSTLNECAKILKNNGCEKVIGLVVAHKK